MNYIFDILIFYNFFFNKYKYINIIFNKKL